MPNKCCDNHIKKNTNNKNDFFSLFECDKKQSRDPCCCFCVDKAAELMRKQMDAYIQVTVTAANDIAIINANPDIPDGAKLTLTQNLLAASGYAGTALQDLYTRYNALISQTCSCDQKSSSSRFL
ncbi:MAG: hypothetical protein Terrestrivirus1_14 [Terrestrivirus sp.]|uniref:Uncharacterized protein n=1 Tax=Terrestrivirus sp. TaxID=2487775 RepID=A0A3G4ZJX4_9VIRU|nr:MAG: hypothetical protein Terrestrivirus1_14 [Terrestrivirus sp.]